MAFVIKQNDTLPRLRATLKEADNTPIDLTDATQVHLVLKQKDGTPSFKNPCTIIDDEAGIVEYEWEAVDTAEDGTYDGEFEITWGTEVQTVPNDKYFDVLIVKDLG
jgi:hypothetical protein